MRKSAFTMVEVLVVVSIIVLLVAILAPVLSSAKKAVLVSSSAARLHQLGIAVQLYQADYDVQLPSIYALPPYSYVYSEFMGFEKDFFVSPCGYKDGIESNQMGLSYQYWAGFDTNEPLFEEHQEMSVLFSDPHCNDSVEQWTSLYSSKRGIAVLFSGKVVSRYKPGDPSQMDWWIEK